MRDKTIDGFRAVAALGVVIAHAVTYRFASSPLPGLHYLQRLADPLAQTSVQIFFVVSGFIITTLLLGEERERGRISITAFYIRRACRILPPLLVLFASILILRSLGLLSIDDPSLVASATFTCNVGIVDCGWWVAHTWSLSVEEQFYLIWPMLLAVVRFRLQLLTITIAILLVTFLQTPMAAHSNYISFACIGIGALYANSPSLRSAVTKLANAWLWMLVATLVLIGPLFIPEKTMQAVMPPLILYMIFAGREIPWVRRILGWKPVQLIGLASYSLYLWQQIFLAKPSLYADSPFPVLLLPVVVGASVLFIEQPMIRLGRRLSSRVLGQRSLVKANATAAMPVP